MEVIIAYLGGGGGGIFEMTVGFFLKNCIMECWMPSGENCLLN